MPRSQSGPTFVVALLGRTRRGFAGFEGLRGLLCVHLTGALAPILLRRLFAGLRGLRRSLVVEAFQAFPFEALADREFEDAEQVEVVFRHEADRLALSFRSSGPANPMDVVLGI